MKSSPLIWHLLHNVKSTVKILLIFVAFLENTNFKSENLLIFFPAYLVETPKPLNFLPCKPNENASNSQTTNNSLYVNKNSQIFWS